MLCRANGDLSFPRPRIECPANRRSWMTRERFARMASVCFYFQVHQPFRLRRYSVFDTDRHYFDDHKNAEIIRKVADKCYLPANKLLLELIRGHEGKFRVAFSLTGLAIEQFEHHVPEVIETFQALAKTKCV